MVVVTGEALCLGWGIKPRPADDTVGLGENTVMGVTPSAP